MAILSVSMNDRTYQELQYITPNRGISEYLSALCEDTWQDWQSAMATLRSKKIGPRTILAACNALGEYKSHHSEAYYAEALCADLQLAESTQGLDAKYQCNTHKLMETIRKDHRVAYAIRDISREYWRKNQRLQALLDQPEDKW